MIGGVAGCAISALNRGPARALVSFANANGHIPRECASIAEVLVGRGWNTYAVGKWHLTAEDETNLAASKKQWPLGRGFERFYGFLGGETSQWFPNLIYDNHPVTPLKSPENGYHLTVDLTVRAIEFIHDAKAIAPAKPFFLYFCPEYPTPQQLGLLEQASRLIKEPLALRADPSTGETTFTLTLPSESVAAVHIGRH